MHFDVPKVVRSPGCDHGHDEESQNGRGVKINILDDYIRTSERFRVIRVFLGTGELREFAGEKYWALLGHTGKREGLPRAGRAPPQGLVRIGLGGRAAPPPSFPSLSSFLESYSYYLEGGESYSRWE